MSYTNKSKKERSPVGPISIEAMRIASIICKHDDVLCDDCLKEAQAAINESKARRKS